MKNLLYAFVLTAMAVLGVSCDKQDDILPRPKNRVSISVDYPKSNVKSGEDDDEPIPTIPVLNAKASYEDGSPIQNANVELLDQPNSNFIDQSITDVEGSFTFYNVQKGSYLFVIKKYGDVVGTQEVDLY